MLFCSEVTPDTLHNEWLKLIVESQHCLIGETSAKLFQSAHASLQMFLSLVWFYYMSECQFILKGLTSIFATFLEEYF